MLRPTFPGGGVPYPPRPGEQGGGLRYVYPPGAGPPGPQGSQGPPSAYSSREGGQVFVRQAPTDSRGGDRAPSTRMPLRTAPYQLYQEFPRDGVQVLGVSRAGEPTVHVVGHPGVPSPASMVPGGLHGGASLSAGLPGGLQSLGGSGHGSPSTVDPGGSSSKRARTDGLAPLRIDTREAVKEPGYHPQVEAISPTPEDRTAERDDVKSTKDNLLQQISKVDREIAKAESQIAKLKKKQSDLEDAANRPTSDSANEDEKPGQSIAQNVYQENRRKANQSHASLEKFSAKNDLPLYNQPSDTEVYNTNKKNYTVFKKKLVDYFKKRNEEGEARVRFMTVTYCKLTSQWSKKVDRVENSRKRKEREGRSREMYEKIFPELRKQREDKERDARLGTRGVVKSEVEFEDVIERLHEQELEDKKMHSYAVIPPLLLDPDERRRKFTNNNGLTQDPMLLYNERKYINMWTDSEKEIFKEKYLQHPKNFGLIAQYLERKTVSDCVEFYYLSKKTENYKQSLRKIRRPRGTRRPQPPTGEVIAPNLPGVVTRRKVEEMQGKGGQGEPQEASQGSSKGNSRSNTPGPANNVATVKQEVENGDSNSGNEKENKKKVERGARTDKKTENQNESSDEEESNQAVKTGPHPCVVCKAVVESSRPVQKVHAAQLGLREEELAAGDARVCTNCWCKTLKKKHAAVCPVAACVKGRNRGKLRSLPPKWNDLDKQNKDTIINELQLPEGTKKVCTACFTRITRRISQIEGNGIIDVVPSSSSTIKKEAKEAEAASWTEEEVEKVRVSLRQNGTNWVKMSTALNSSRTEEQCKKFFYNQRKRLQFDKVVLEYKRANIPEGSDKPSLTSDEESGSSTSSCEEDPSHSMEVDGQPDTKEMDLKPPVVPPAPSENKQEGQTDKKVDDVGYDSSATMSADETGELQQPVKAGRPAGPPANLPAAGISKPATMNDLLENIITHTLHTTTAPPPAVVTTAPVRSETLVPNLNNILEAAGPVNHRNFVRNALSQETTTASTSGPLPVSVSRPDREVRPVIPPQAAAPVLPALEDGVLNLTVARSSPRSSPAPSISGHPDPSGYPAHYTTARRPEPVPETLGKEPPPAHGGNKAKTTHMEMMKQDPTSFLQAFRPDNKSPAPGAFSDRSVHSPGPIRQDPRKDIPKTHPPPLHPNKSGLGAHPSLQITSRTGTGSLMQGTPKAPPGAPPQHSPRYAEQASHHTMKDGGLKGSIMTGNPVYSRGGRLHPAPLPQDSGRSSHPDLQSRSPYPPYQQQSPRPTPSHVPRGQAPSSRSVVEEAYATAQTLPRKDPREPSSANSYPRPVDPRGPPREVSHTVDPRMDPAARFSQDPRSLYTNPRFPSSFSGGPMRGDPRDQIPTSTARGDPRGDIPPRGEPSSRAEQNVYRDPRMQTVDPRDPRQDPRVPIIDPRRSGASYPGYDPRMPHHPGHEPPRTLGPSHHLPSKSSNTRVGSIPQGVPNSKVRPDADYHRPNQEVTITKQDSLYALAAVADDQPRLYDGRDQQRPPLRQEPSRGGPSGSAGPMVDPRVSQPSLFDRNKVDLGPPRAPSRERRPAVDPQEILAGRLNQMTEAERQVYIEQIHRMNPDRHQNMNAKQLIEHIVTKTMNKPQVGTAPVNQARHSPLTVADGKDSPSKPPSRSPSVKSLTERDGLDGGASGSGGVRTSPVTMGVTMGEHLENMINKEVNRTSTTSPYQAGPSSSENHEQHWKRRGYSQEQTNYSQGRPPSQPRPPSNNSHPQLGTDERQILRVAQNTSPRPDKPPSRSMHEAISPPTSDPGRSHPGYYPGQPQDPAMSRYLAARRKDEDQRAEQAARVAASKGVGGPGVTVDDYVKYKITEVMKNEKGGGAGPSDLSGCKPSHSGVSMGPPHKRPLEVEARNSPHDHPGGANPESPRKRYKQDDGAGGSNDMPDSPESGDMVIDETARPDSAHSHKTNSPAPNADPSHYPPGYRGGPGHPPRSSPAPYPGTRPPPQTSTRPPTYEPLSEED